MTRMFHTKPIRIASSAPAARGVSGNRFATMLTGGAVVLAMVLATAMPARADKNDDLAKALIAALVIGAIVHETKRDDPKPEPVRQPRVPAVCAISISGAQRDVTLFPESCLRREGFDYRLPLGCANQARIFGKRDRVYSAQCLRDAGFRLSDR
jgi:hypothetical protein